MTDTTASRAPSADPPLSFLDLTILRLLNRIAPVLLGRSRADRLRAHHEHHGMLHLDDRRLMAEAYTPALIKEGGRLLWVGTQPYTTVTCLELAARGVEVWTTDIDRNVERWGVPGQHRTGDITHADSLFADLTFDTVVLNGVFGYGLNDEAAQRRTFCALAAIMKPGGLLLLGWNTDRSRDPVASGMAELFEAADFADRPSRVVCQGGTHVYDAMRRR